MVYTTFHHPATQANVVTTDNSDWATNCPEYKVTAVQVSASNGPSEWQEEYRHHSEIARRILPPVEAHVAFDHRRLTGQERLDQIAAEGYGDPHLWWRIMDASGTADPAELEAETGRLLALPLPLEVARNGGT